MFFPCEILILLIAIVTRMDATRKYKMTDREKTRYEIVKNREVFATRFLHIPTLERLGMLESMQSFLDHAGIGNLLGRCAKTYPELTRQFVATFTTESEDHACIGLRFKFNKRKYTVNFSQLQEAFGVSLNPSDQWWDGPPTQDLVDFWRAATGSSFRTRGE